MSELDIKNLCVYYGKKEIIKDVSFSLNKGELICLLGCNGSGKTTLLKGLCSLAKTTGERLINGTNITSLHQKELSRCISYIPQSCQLNVPISVLDVVLMGFSPYLSVFENTNDSHKKQAKEALQKVGLLHKKEESYLTLSGGQKQLVIIARALVQNTPIMIFDEPDSALDFTNKHKIMSLIKDLVHNEKSGIICLHDANTALKYCDRALLVKDGIIIHDIHIKVDSRDKIETALQKIYGEVELISHNKSLIMVKK